MIIRTISQLPKTGDDGLPPGSLFEVSVVRDNKYISKCIDVAQLGRIFKDYAIDEIVNDYQMKSGGDSKISLSSVFTQSNTLSANDCEIHGNKTFTGQAYFGQSVMKDEQVFKLTDTEKDNRIATIGYVQSALKNNPSLALSSSQLDCGYIDKYGNSSPDVSKMITLYFDPAKSGDAKQSDEAITPKAGQLILYGWLADNGNVDSSAAWVALEGKIRVKAADGSEQDKWVILQLQPWIVGQKHNNLQYIGFNINVAEGLSIRISTGFNLNYDNSTYQGRPNSLVLNLDAEKTNIANAFVGYVI